MEALLYVALWAVIIWFWSQRLQGLKGAGNSDNAGLRWVPPIKDVDPACGKMVTTDGAKSSVYDGNVYYFCSRECREVFEAAPNLYLGDGTKKGHGAEFPSALIGYLPKEKNSPQNKLKL